MHARDPQNGSDYKLGAALGRVEVRCSAGGFVIEEQIHPLNQTPAGSALRLALTDVPDDARKIFDHMHEGCRTLQYASAKLARQLADDDRDGHLSITFESADGLVNLCGATVPGDEHLRVPVRIYLETDPVLPQIEVAQGRQFTIDLLRAHTHHFTFGENLGAPDCQVPLGPFRYFPTRQPVVLDWWKPLGGNGSGAPGMAGRFTTIASWRQSGKDIAWNGETYTWSKHLEFLKLIDLPRLTPDAIELALAAADNEAIELLTSKAWKVVDALALSKDIRPYRRYIRASRGEFTVAKDQNIRLCSGWFSDRSACYLAAGRPVITQETGFSKVLPTGQGLFAFRRLDDVLSAMDTIRSDYVRQSRAAREIASEYFAAEKVAGTLLEQAGL